jgi:hypothetical protein
VRYARIATAEIAIASQLIVARTDTRRRVARNSNFDWGKEDPKVKIDRSSYIGIILSDSPAANAVSAIALIFRAIAGLFVRIGLGLAPTAAGASDRLSTAGRLRSHRMRRTSHWASQQAEYEDQMKCGLKHTTRLLFASQKWKSKIRSTR